jgi:replicative superfamily II helicase
MISAWISGANIRVQIENAIQKFHSDGPVSPLILEQLTYYKHFHPDVFLEYERKLMYVMGLFYKTTEPQSILEEVYSLYAGAIQDEVGKVFTPVQASALKSIKKKRYFSFSAPTSSGKSYLFRELLQQINGDIVIVVPSRALIAEYYHEVISLVENDTLVLQFIDNINTAKTTRRIFIITPERGGELFKRLADFRIKLFLFDEAQISEEEIRGLKFDAFVRRIDRNIPEAKKVFAHPFVENPQAQLSKHGFANDSQAKLYSQQSVGKLFLSHRDGAFAFFSPNTESPNISAQNDLIENIIKGGGTLLVYVSKRLIYSNELRERFSRYIALCSNVENAEAIALIEELRSFIGASVDISDKYSLMIGMMEQGVVIHHGSMPLKARLLVETFIKKGFARVCFSTSTLGQGVNMPFDVVWVNNFHNMKPLTLKNLIGRAGRTSSTANSFDYGYTVVEERNVNTFISRYKEHYHINETSRLDEAIGQVERDYLDIVEAIHNDAFADDYNMPQVQIDRLDNSEVQQKIKYILDTLFVDRRILLGNEYYELSESKRRDIKAAFRAIYIAHLRDRELTNSEKSILSAAIPILLWQVQGKSFT